jgi:uroporphyrinogen-III decarboxylase
MTSKERMLAVLEYEDIDYIPCSFMLFENLYNRCKNDHEFVEEQLKYGVDATVHVGHLDHRMHLTGSLSPDIEYKEWVEEKDGVKYFCREIDTPKGKLTSKIKQWEGWPTKDDFPIFKDWIVPRIAEPLVNPEEDIEKVRYLFGPFKDEDINRLREEADAARKIANKYNLYQVGGWKGFVKPGLQVDPGVMGCDAMAYLSGFKDIMILSVIKPGLIKEYADIIHKWNMKQIEIYLDVTAADLIIRRAWYETTEFWTPKAYREIILPTIKREVNLVHQAGKKYGYIITSAFLPILDDILDSGIDVLIGLDPEEGKGTDIMIMKKKFIEKRKTIWGGVSGAITIECGTEKETEVAVIRALKILGKGGGFILSPVDDVRVDTENAWKNTEVFVKTWKKYRSDYIK